MTSTSSADALALPIDTFASVIATSVAALDAGPIETGYPIYVARLRSADDASVDLARLKDAYEEPERPRWHPALEEGGYVTLVGDRPGRFRSCLDDSEKNLTWLRERIAGKPFNGWDDITLEQTGKRAQATLDKILAWRAECDRCRAALGLPAAEAKAEVLTRVALDTKKAILAQPAETFREAAFKAAVINSDWDDAAAIRLLDELQRLAGIPNLDEEG